MGHGSFFYSVITIIIFTAVKIDCSDEQCERPSNQAAGLNLPSR